MDSDTGSWGILLTHGPGLVVAIGSDGHLVPLNHELLLVPVAHVAHDPRPLEARLLRLGGHARPRRRRAAQREDEQEELHCCGR